MEFLELKSPRPRPRINAFTLIEMLVVIAIMAILMTAGAIGLGGLGGKNVTSAVASAESLFDEARSLAIGKNLRSCVLVSKSLTNAKGENLRKILIATEDANADGTPVAPTVDTPNWVISSRGFILPDQVYFSENFSKEYKSSDGSTKGPLEEIPHTQIKLPKTNQQGTWFIYKFNSQGVRIPKGANPTDPVYAATFVVGAGTRDLSGVAKPKVVGSERRDFGGFVIWRGGNSTMFHSPDQISTTLKTFKSGDEF